MKHADIIIIGSGIACTATLVEVFNRLLHHSQEKIKIAVIEKHSEFWLGVPYGSRSSVNALTITNIHDFFTNDEERTAFTEWFEQNKEKLITHYLSEGGLTAEQWLQRNCAAIENKDWKNIYMPRYFCGKYQKQKFEHALQLVKDKGLAELHLISGDAIDIQPKGSGYEVFYESDNACKSLTAGKVVIATGSAPLKNIIWPQGNNSVKVINDLYVPGAKENIAKLVSALTEVENVDERNVLIIGSNASSIELLYLLAGLPEALALINKLVVISRSGLLPYHIITNPQDNYPTENLDKLKTGNNYTLETLIEASKKDIRIAVKGGVIVPYIDKIINYTIELLQSLNEDSKKEFIGIYGMQLSGLFRRSGTDYKTATGLLSEIQKLHLLKGFFSHIEPKDDAAILYYTDPDSQEQLTYSESFKVVINCTGSEDLSKSPDRLIYNLVNNGIAEANLSRKGFLVNENFEAAPNLYVIGPLLGGNRNKRIYFWHLENASRILYLAPYLAEVLVS